MFFGLYEESIDLKIAVHKFNEKYFFERLKIRVERN